MNRITNALHTAPVIFIVLTSALLGASIFFPSLGNTTAPTKNDKQEMRGTVNAKASANYVQGVQTIQSWWNANWNYRKLVTFVEPGVMSRDRDPCNIFVSFVGNVARNNSIRLTAFTNMSTWIEVPSQIWNATFHTSGLVTYYTSCTIFFYNNITKGTTSYYYIYYDPNISTRANYGIHITIRAHNNPAITTDTHIQPTITYANGTVSPRVNSFDVIVNNNTAKPQATICLVDTMRGSLGGGANGSDWGGPVDSPISMLNNGVETLNLTGQEWISVGEAALDAIGYDTSHNVGNGFSGAYRVNVEPDNPAESWDGIGSVTVLAVGALFAMVKIHTTDGAYANAPAYVNPSANWYIDNMNKAGLGTDTVTRGADGGLGYVTYDILYTFYYYGGQTFMQIQLNFTATPQRGAVGSGYPVQLANYTNTNVYFKNYGDWPHLMQIVVANQGLGNAPLQSVKSWNGTKYGLATQVNNAFAKRNDFPTQPWLTWWDNSSKHNPSIGMLAVTNPVGWQVLSLAVPGIGANGMLQQILPEGLQGSNYLLPRGSTLKYDYYLLTDSYTYNYTSTANMCYRMNKPVSVQVGIQELFSNNAIFVHVQDHSGQTTLGVQVTLRNSTFLSSQNVNGVGNVTFTPIPDGTYTLQVNFTTGITTYIANSSTLVLNHAITRYYYIHSPTSIANLTVILRNKAEGNSPISGAQIRIVNATNNNTILQGLTDQYGSPIMFRLYSNVASNTPYYVQVYYGGILRVTNISQNPYPLSGNTILNLGVAIDTTEITILSQPSSVGFGSIDTITFTYHKSGNSGIQFVPQDIKVSSSYLSQYWVKNTDYTWSNASGIITLNLLTGPSKKLNNAGVYTAYVYAINGTVENATAQLSIIVDPTGTNVKVFVNGTDITSLGTYEIRFTESFKIDVQYYTIVSPANITAASVTMTNSSGHSFSFVTSGGNYTTTINSKSLGTANAYSFVINCSKHGYATQLFKFTIFTEPVQAELRVKNPDYPGFVQKGNISLSWSDTTTFYLTYWDTTNNVIIPQSGTTVVMIIGTRYFSTTPMLNGSYQVVLDTSLYPVLVGGTTLITFQANNPSYFLSEFIFNLYTAPINMSASFTINGYTEDKFPGIYLTQTANIVVNVTTVNLQPVAGAAATITFGNDVTPSHPDYVVGPNSTSVNIYTFNTVIDLNRFYGKKQFFYLHIVKKNYTDVVQTIIFDVNPINVVAVFTSPGIAAGSNTITPDLNTNYNITVTLNNTLLGIPFTTNITSIELFMTGGPLTSEVQLYNLGNGRFTYQLSADKVSNFTLTLRVYVPSNMELQYQITRTFNVFVAVKEPTGGIPAWVFWLVFSGLVAVVAWFILYQVRFKYPPLVRKIHDLKRVVARGRVASRIPKQKVKTREENIFQVYAKQINEYGFLQTRDSRYAARAAGYAPVPDQSISLEFEMPAIDKGEIEALDFQGPKVSGKAPAKQYAELEPPAAPAPAPAIPKPMTRPAPPQPGVKKIAPVKPVKPTGVKPPAKPAVKALPKPSVPLPRPAAVPSAIPSSMAAAEPSKQENLYQDLVLLEQKRYKAERSLRDLDAKHTRGVISDEEYNEYNDKIKESLDKLKENIAQLRRKMLSF